MSVQQNGNELGPNLSKCRKTVIKVALANQKKMMRIN